MTVSIFGRGFENAAVWANNIKTPHICGNFGMNRGYCAHFGRIECLSPHILTA